MNKYLFFFFFTLQLNAVSSDAIVVEINPLEIESGTTSKDTEQSEKLSCCCKTLLLPLAFVGDVARMFLWSTYYIAELPRFLAVEIINFYLCCANDEQKENLEGCCCYPCFNGNCIDVIFGIDGYAIKLKDLFRLSGDLFFNS
jgi:hypothetical protein